jgi:phospholipase C
LPARNNDLTSVHKDAVTEGPPLVNDPQPFYGSQHDLTKGAVRQPSSRTDSKVDAAVASNLTFAGLPLTFMGNTITPTLDRNLSPGNPKEDLADIQQDIPFIAKKNYPPVNWRWYQEGYDLEASDMMGVQSEGNGQTFTGDGRPSHNGYVLHHNGAAYFGYIANTPDVAQTHLKGMTDFFADFGSTNNKLPEPGVFYIRGGFINQQNLRSPVFTNTNLTPADVERVPPPVP